MKPSPIEDYYKFQYPKDDAPPRAPTIFGTDLSINSSKDYSKCPQCGGTGKYFKSSTHKPNCYQLQDCEHQSHT